MTPPILAFLPPRPTSPELCDVNAVISACQSRMMRSVPRDVDIALDLCVRPLICDIDIGQFELALVALVTHTQSAMTQRGTIRIKTLMTGTPAARGDDANDWVEVIVMANHDRHPQVEGFDAVDAAGSSPQRNLQWTELGHVRSFIARCGGAVTLEGDRGARISLRLPRRTMAVSGTDEASAGPLNSAIDHPETQTVLVVEDDSLVREIVVDTLDHLGYRVLVASDGPEALTILKTETDLDLLFTDVIMPNGITGVELAYRAREMRPGLKILLTSGYASRGQSENSTATSGFPMLGKPYHLADLAHTIRSVING